MMLAASCSESQRDGAKSPFLLHSELSILHALDSDSQYFDLYIRMVKYYLPYYYSFKNHFFGCLEFKIYNFSLCYLAVLSFDFQIIITFRVNIFKNLNLVLCANLVYQVFKNSFSKLLGYFNRCRLTAVLIDLF
jgi:hypothetical protein